MALKLLPIQMINVQQLAAVIQGNISKVLVVDCRSFLEYNDNHVMTAKNIYCSKLMKRRLQQGKVSLKDLLLHCQIETDGVLDVIVYDHGTCSLEKVAVDSFIYVLLKKLTLHFQRVHLLTGGFVEFNASFPELCDDKGNSKCPALTSLSQPCLPTNIGPTRILPYLYLGSEEDANNKDMLQSHNILYELNVSTNLSKPDFIQDSNFLRVPVNDSHNERLLPFFQDTCNFVEKAKESSGCVLIHCLAGISRSPTVAIAYVMRNLKMSCEDAYRYVKSKRANISPNFNFLGQLLEYEKQLQNENILDSKPERKEIERSLVLERKPTLVLPLSRHSPKQERSIMDLSPTTALAQLNFEGKENWLGNSTKSEWTQTCTVKQNFFVSTTIRTEHVDMATTFQGSSLSDISFMPCKSSVTDTRTTRKIPSPVKLELKPRFVVDSASVFDSTWFSRNRPLSVSRSDSVCTRSSGLGSELSDADITMENHLTFDDGCVDEGVFCEGISPQPSPGIKPELGTDCSFRLRRLVSVQDEGKITSSPKLRDSLLKCNADNIRSPEKRKSCELSFSKDHKKSEKRRSYVSPDETENKPNDDKSKTGLENMPIDDHDKENCFKNGGFERSIGGRFSGRSALHKKLEMLVKPSNSEGLYRVQSCPSNIDAGVFPPKRILSPPESPEPVSDSALLSKLRTSTKCQHNSIRNRYSCGSIEYTDLQNDLSTSSTHSSTSTLALISVQ